MNIVRFAKKLQNKLLKGKQPFFTMSIEKQHEILYSFEEPKSLLERSYFQYLCQMKQLPFLFRFLQSTSSIFALVYYYFKPCEKVNAYSDIKNIALFISGLNDMRYIPKAIVDEFDQIIYQGYDTKITFTRNDKRLINEIIAEYWYKPYFVLKCVMKIGLYSQNIRNYSPAAILTFGEFSFASSILTLYCNQQKIKHINIMHGEKLFNIRDSFVKFDKYYVWDEYYTNLMLKLRADKEQFVVDKPPIVILEQKSKLETKFFLTYYLADESKLELISIRNSLVATNIPIELICIRYHPRFCDDTIIKSIFNGFEIENPFFIDISQSFSRTKNISSLYSTVLFQAYCNNKPIIIDDVSNSSKYEKLKELNYIMINKKHQLLSEINYGG